MAALIAWTACVFALIILSRTAPSARLRASSTRHGAAASGGLRSLTRLSKRTEGSSKRSRPLSRRVVRFLTGGRLDIEARRCHMSARRAFQHQPTEACHAKRSRLRRPAVLSRSRVSGGEGYPSETHVRRGDRTVHGDKELTEKLGRNDLCPCGSGRRFQDLLPALWSLPRQRAEVLCARLSARAASWPDTRVAPECRLVPAIHVFLCVRSEDVDARVKPAHDMRWSLYRIVV